MEPGLIAKFSALDEMVQPVEYVLQAESCTLGRSAECDIVVDYKIVSRLHARIERQGPHYLLHDLNSANGTFVNGHRIHEPHLLRDKDVISLGETRQPLLQFNDPDDTAIPPGRLDYNPQTMMFFLNEQPVELTPAEFRLLHHLFQYAGDVCTREACARAVWVRDYNPLRSASALDRVMANLREKLRQIDPVAADLIETRRGLGYVLNL
jgi:DNA-binding response OmpR family regulator